MKSILVTGGTGLVGNALIENLIEKKYSVTVLTRDHASSKRIPGVEYAFWNIKEGIIDKASITSADGIIHLAGAGVMDKKWTERYKKVILESRTKSTELLIKTLQENDHKVKVFISASAIGWYGADKIRGHKFFEDEGPDTEFLGEVCMLWEKSSEPAEKMGIRVCRLRTGIVLSSKGGAYPEFKKSLKFGIAAILGSGKQIVSWIHIDDLSRAYIFAMENEEMTGNYNAVAPMPVSNKILTLTIGDEVRGKYYLPVHVPKIALEILIGGRSIEILKSASVSSYKLEDAGFTFMYPNVKKAVHEIENEEITDQPL